MAATTGTPKPLHRPVCRSLTTASYPTRLPKQNRRRLSRQSIVFYLSNTIVAKRRPVPHPGSRPATRRDWHPARRPWTHPSKHRGWHPGRHPWTHPSKHPGLRPGRRPWTHPSTRRDWRPGRHPSMRRDWHLDLRLSMHRGSHPCWRPRLASLLASRLASREASPATVTPCREDIPMGGNRHIGSSGLGRDRAICRRNRSRHVTAGREIEVISSGDHRYRGNTYSDPKFTSVHVCIPIVMFALKMSLFSRVSDR